MSRSQNPTTATLVSTGFVTRREQRMPPATVDHRGSNKSSAGIGTGKPAPATTAVLATAELATRRVIIPRSEAHRRETLKQEEPAIAIPPTKPTLAAC